MGNYLSSGHTLSALEPFLRYHQPDAGPDFMPTGVARSEQLVEIGTMSASASPLDPKVAEKNAVRRGGYQPFRSGELISHGQDTAHSAGSPES